MRRPSHEPGEIVIVMRGSTRSRSAERGREEQGTKDVVVQLQGRATAAVSGHDSLKTRKHAYCSCGCNGAGVVLAGQFNICLLLDCLLRLLAVPSAPQN